MSEPATALARSPIRHRAEAGTAALRFVFGLASPSGRHARLSVLIFHRVRPAADPLFPGEPTAAGFRRRMLSLREYCTFVDLGDAVGRLARGALPARAVAVTFDDGYADNAQVALPILRELGIPATFFVATGFLDGGRMWNDTIVEAVRAARGPRLDLRAPGLGVYGIDGIDARRAAIHALITAAKHRAPAERDALVDAVATACGEPLPCDLMMTRDEVRSLAAAGMGIGAHTITHPILARAGAAQARHEIGGGREALEAIVGLPVRLFAYPNGRPGDDYGHEHVRLVRNMGFSAAFSTAHGAARQGDPLFELPRFTPWDRTPLRFGARLVKNLWTRARRAPAGAADGAKDA